MINNIVFWQNERNIENGMMKVSEVLVNQRLYCKNNFLSRISSATKGILAIPALVLVDLFAIALSLLIAYAIRTYFLPMLLPEFFPAEMLANTLPSLWWVPLIYIACMAYEDLYQKRLPFWTEVEKTLKAGTLAVTFSILLLYLGKISGTTSRTWVIMTWLLTIIVIPQIRYFGKLALIKVHIWNKPVLIVGAGKTGQLIVNALTREKTMGYEIIGVLDDILDLEGLVNPKTKCNISILGTFDEVEKVILGTNIQEVIVAAPGLPPKELVELTNRLQSLTNNVMLVPDLVGLSMSGIEVGYFFDEQTLLLNLKNKLRSTFNRAVKRTFDLVFGSLFLILSVPIVIVIAIALKLDSPGPVFFSQDRLGQNGLIFTCYKFRTMYLAGEKLLKNHLKKNKEARQEWETYNKLKNSDPRITRVGSLLRKFSLDELPQLLNVLMGDMSLVGPRPYMMRERIQMGNFCHEIQVSRPGITGLWQVSGRNEIEFEGRLKLDVWYVRNWSLLLDMILLVRTIRVVLKRDGAY